MQTIHSIKGTDSHFGWDNSIPPVLTVAPGATIALELNDASGGQLTKNSTPDTLSALDFARVNPVTGPVHIDGAEPGDAIAITFVAFEASADWGWTAIIPGFGLLSDEFPDPKLNIWNYNSLESTARFKDVALVPLNPFAGTVGLALGQAGNHSVVPPRRVGGNLDMRDISTGAVLTLPVEVPGGLFSIGDAHAAQGDGEVCGTAIETTMLATVKLDLIKDAGIDGPRVETAGPVTRHLDADGYLVTTGVGPDLMIDARDAVRSMIDLLGQRTGMAPDDAYMLCSVVADLRITEIVDAPNWVVACYLPKLVISDHARDALLGG